MWRRLLCNALTVSLMAGGLVVIALPQAHAAADAVVSGIVVDSVTRQALMSVTVTDSTSGRSTTTAAAGTYSLSIPAGNHVLTATLAGHVPSATPKLTLAAGQTLTTQGFTLQKYASASGIVTEKGTTTGVAAVVVKFFDGSTGDPNPVTASTTGPDGSWSIAHIAPGTYTVQFDGTGTGFLEQWYDGVASRDKATELILGAGEKRTIPGVLTRQKVVAASAPASAPPAAGTTITAQAIGSVSGHVRIDPDNLPAGSAVVTASLGDGTIAATATADANGAYSFSGIPSGYYIVDARSSDAPALRGYLGGAVSRTLATYVWLGEGTTLAGQDINLQRTAALSGTVTDRGLPVAGAYVSLTGMGVAIGTVITDTAGSFQITSIPPGRYRLGAQYGGQMTWWNGASTIGGGSEITIASNASLNGYELVVPPSYVLSGTLHYPDGTNWPDGTVLVTDGTRQWTLLTDQSGRYSVSVPPGSYEVGLSNGYGAAVWSPGSVLPDIFPVAGDIVKDLTLTAPKAVTVTVATSDGSAAASLRVQAFNAHQEWMADATVVGGVASLSLPQGTYRLWVVAANTIPQSTTITVTGPLEVAITLPVGGMIRGTIPQHAVVTATNAVTGETFLYYSSSTYTLGGLPTGDYVLSAAPLDAYFYPCGRGAWYGGTTYLTASRLHVGNGTTLTDKNLTVACDANWVTDGEVVGDIAMPPAAPSGAAAGVVVSAESTVTSLSTATEADGTFAFPNLAPGTYTITAYQPTLGYEGHATVTIEPGTSLILTLTMTKKGRVAGQVVGPHGEPVDAAVGDGETEVRTDGQGNFSLGGISFGTHTLTVLPAAPYAPTFVDVTVAAGADVLGLTIPTRLAGTLSGQLAASAGPVKVTVIDAAGRVVGADSFWYSFSFASIPPGPVKVFFSGLGIDSEWWRDAADAASATPVEVPEGGGVTDVTPNLRATPTGSGVTEVTGRVTHGGSPLAGVNITVDVGSTMIKATTTAADGTYRITVPRAGTYQVNAVICLGPPTSPCAGQYYADARNIVANGSTVPGVDFVVPLVAGSFTVAPQPVITGRQAVGMTLTATVETWTPVPDTTTWQWYADGLAIYGATGSTVTVTQAETGKHIQVVVTRKKAGYATLTLPSAPTEPVEVPGAIRALTPSRLLDSRIGQGYRGPVSSGAVITLPVWGKGGVPAGASAVLVNITVTEPTATGFLVAYASGSAVPWVSNSNFAAGTTWANLSLVPVGADGAIALRPTLPGTVQVIVDVQGYVVGGTASAGGAIVPVTPTRVIDTRESRRVAAGATLTIPVAGVAGVPADASAVVANVTVTGPTTSGYLTAYPAGVASPTASNVNFVARQTVPNLAIVKVGDSRSISVYNSGPGSVDIVVDIQGYVNPGTATLSGTVIPVTPQRVVDTRINLGVYGSVAPYAGRWADLGSPSGLPKLPQAALVNLTVTEPRAPGWLSVYPDGVDRPLVSNLNYPPGTDVPNLSLATLNNGLAILYNGSAGTVQIVVDVLAYVLP